ncbi:lytic polysaccharide monooxygenase AA11 family protein [Aspergillus lucknowensis]|uniref:Lytic polysaccharide monooxygenase n=1 Tax=Aspergillus lucknowensis TaxID=176173 RepID=A0ABR4LEN9_9EURO
MLSKSVLAVVTALGASIVEAHQYMVQPVPYNYNPDSFSNAPLSADGSDFPCRNAGDYSVVTENHMAIGESQELAFLGTAVHGGGSCQVSITPDRAPTKDTKWSVIKSIEGGCVANVDENLPGANSKTPNPYTFNFTIPSDVEPGKYTMAYTWINRIGNREMYMDCAPITVSGGSSSKRSETTEVAKRSLDNYPDMFIANINGCKTTEGVDIRYPCPGNDIEYLGEPANLAPEGDKACEGAATWGAAGYTCSAGSGSGSTPEEPPTEQPTSTVSVGVTVAVPEYTPEPTQPTEPSPVAPTSTTVEPAPTSAVPEPSSPSTSGGLTGPCTDEGTWNCIGGTSFQRCASGVWSEVQAMASGTECTEGQTKDFAVKAIGVKSRMLKEKRFHRRSHGHIHA